MITSLLDNTANIDIYLNGSCASLPSPTSGNTAATYNLILAAADVVRIRLSGGTASGFLSSYFLAGFTVDSFTDTDGTILTSHTGELGATWTGTNGTTGAFTINSNKISGSNSAQSSGTPASADYESSILLNAASLSVESGCFVRNQAGATTYYRATLTASPTVQIYKFVGGTFTLLATAAFAQNVGQKYLLTLRAAGTRLDLMIDGVTILTATDSAISTAGTAAVYSTGSTSSAGYQGVDFVAGNSPATRQIVWDGNSQIIGNGSMIVCATQMQSAYPFWDVNNAAVAGHTTVQQTAAASTSVTPLLLSGNGVNIVAFSEVINDVYLGATAEQAWANLQAYSAAVRGINGSKLIILTPQRDRADFPGTSTLPGADAAAQEAVFVARIADFMATYFYPNWATICDGYYDVFANNNFVVANFQGDGVHWTTALEKIAAMGVAGVMKGPL